MIDWFNISVYLFIFDVDLYKYVNTYGIIFEQWSQAIKYCWCSTSVIWQLTDKFCWKPIEKQVINH